MASKGKGVARDNSSGKRKRGDSGDDDKSGGGLKSRNRSVLQFFEDEADDIDVDWTDDSDFDNDFLENDPSSEPKNKNDTGKGQNLPLFPKPEELGEEEFDKMMEGQYSDGSRLLLYTENKYDDKKFVGQSSLPFSYKDPITWKVKCMVGRERQSVFCLMQKFVELKSLGTKLQLLSAFAVEHVKGFIFIEAEKQNDVIEACKGIGNIYVSRMASVPRTDVSHYLSVQIKGREISEGMWARVKNGKYKGDLAQIVSVNNERKRATVKLIPRIDLKMMAEKFGGGVAAKRNSTPIPAPKLISASELEEFRPLIQYRRDRETGKLFQFFDGLMLKDGYLFKKVSLDSLNCWNVIPTEEEVLKFKVSENNEADNLGWLSQLYGEQKKGPVIRNEKGGGKGEGSSGSSVGFELYDLVCFGRKDFGVIVGTEKDDSYKILKDSSEGPTVVNVRQKDLKYGPFFDTKFTASDLTKKILSVNDTVKVLQGPSQGREGIVKYIYRNTIFIHDENEEVNGGYLCCKAQMCEKIKFSYDADKCGEMISTGFEDIPSSPKSPLSPDKPWETKEKKYEFNRGDKDGMFSIGQTLRIRVGPLKGYLCRVLAIRRMDVTVKLDSQHKVLTVKSEHLSEVRDKSTVTFSEDPVSTTKTFDLLGTEDGSKDWMGGVGTSTGSDGWAGGLSTERSSWPTFPASSSLLQPGSSSANNWQSGESANKDAENAPWESKVVSKQASDPTVAVASSQSDDWGKSESWGKGSDKTSFNASASDGWEKPAAPNRVEDPSDSWGKGKSKIDSSGDGDGANKDAENAPLESKVVSKQNLSWGAANTSIPIASGQSGDSGKSESWGEGSVKTSFNACASDGWKKPAAPNVVEGESDSWGKGKSKMDSCHAGSPWENRNDINVSRGDRVTSEHPWDKKSVVENKMGIWDAATEVNVKPYESTKDGLSGNKGWGADNKADACAKICESSKPDGRKVKDQEDGWNVKKTSDIGSSSGWSQSTSLAGSGPSIKKPHSDGGLKGNWNAPSADVCLKEDTRLDGQSPRTSVSNDDGLNEEKKNNWNVSSGNKNNWGSGSAEGSQNQDSDWARKGNTGSDEECHNQVSDWGKKGNWDSGSSHNEKKAVENKKSNWGNSGQNQASNWGKKGNSEGNQNSNQIQSDDWNSGSGSASAQSDLTEGKQSNWNSQSGGVGKDGDSNWGKKSTLNSGSNWGGKSNWNNGNDSTTNQSRGEDQTEANDSRGNWGGGFGGRGNSDGGFRGRGGFGGRRGGRGFGGRDRSDEHGNDFTNNQSTWNSESGVSGKDGDSNSGKKSTWNSGSNWGGKSNWNNGNDSSTNLSSGEDQTEINNSRGNWREGLGDKGDSDGGFRGRGGFGGRRGGRGFGGRDRSDEHGNEDQTETNDSGGNWRGGFRGRSNSDGGFRGRGGFGGRRGGRGFGGRGRTDEGSFGDGNESGRGGFGGRGRGRRDWNNDSGGKRDWNNDSGGGRRDWNNDSGGSRADRNYDSSKPWSRNGESSNDEGWKNNASSGTWKGGNDEKNQQQTWNSGNGGASNTAGVLGSQPTESGSAGSSWKSSDGSGGSQWSSWNKGKGLNEKNAGSTEASNRSDGWNKEIEKPATDTIGGAGWSKGTTGSTSEKGSGSAWGKEAANSPDKGEGSSWGKQVDKKGEHGSWGNEAASAGQSNKGEASSWGKQNDGNKGGGW